MKRRKILEYGGVILAGVGLGLGLVSCDRNKPQSIEPKPTTSPSSANKGLQLKSFAFEPNGLIPVQYTCDGDNISPPLTWDKVPNGTQSLALIVDDPDAPGRTFVHWVVYNIPANITELSESLPSQAKLDSGILQGINGFREIGYGGPCPPSGTHRYVFTLYALSTKLELTPEAKKSELITAIDGHILGQAELIGRYAQKR